MITGPNEEELETIKNARKNPQTKSKYCSVCMKYFEHPLTLTKHLDKHKRLGEL